MFTYSQLMGSLAGVIIADFLFFYATDKDYSKVLTGLWSRVGYLIVLVASVEFLNYLK